MDQPVPDLLAFDDCPTENAIEMHFLYSTRRNMQFFVVAIPPTDVYDRSVPIPLPQFPTATSCGQLFLDTQDPFTHTPIKEKRVRINQLNTKETRRFQ